MPKILDRLLRTAALPAALLVAAGVLAQESPKPVRLDPEKMAGLNLTAIPPGSYQEICGRKRRCVQQGSRHSRRC